MFCKYYNKEEIELLVNHENFDEFVNIRANRHKLVYTDYWEDVRVLFSELDSLKVEIDFDATIKVGKREDLSEEQFDKVNKIIHRMIPWRKGPYEIFGINIDSEWNCELKVQRYLSHFDYEDKNVLDIGCANGYYLMRLLKYNPKLLFGIDPSDRGFLSAHLIQNYLQSKIYCHDMFGLEDLRVFKPIFDIVFFMGVLYHRRDPIKALSEVKSSCAQGARVLIETLVHPGDQHEVLIPKDRYCHMRNVYHVPTLSYLYYWIEQAGFSNLKLIDLSETTFEEQRRTEWMPFFSLSDFLAPGDPSRTVEGYPAPKRAMIIAEVA